MHFHERVNHGSERCTVSILREKFWVVKARQQVRRVIRQCTFCKRYNRRRYRVPAEANLPVERLSQAAAFTHIGVDFAGPLYLKYFDPEAGSNKAYICLFTCASSRAVHLEVTQSLTVVAFFAGFQKIRGKKGRSSDNLFRQRKDFQRSERRCQGFCVFPLPEFFPSWS